jgi:hypothetical protein
VVTIDFINKLHKIARQYDSTMVVVDKLTKVAYFILAKLSDKAAKISKFYMKQISRLHGVRKAIVPYRYPKFTSNFLIGPFKGFNTNLNFSTTCHPQIHG